MARQPKSNVSTADRRASEARLASLAEAAEHARCSPDTIRRRIADGTLTGYRFGPRRILVDLDELDAKLRPIPTAGGVG